MNISEMIKELELLKKEYGDLKLECNISDLVILGVSTRKGYPGIEDEIIGVLCVQNCFDCG